MCCNLISILEGGPSCQNLTQPADHIIDSVLRKEGGKGEYKRVKCASAYKK